MNFANAKKVFPVIHSFISLLCPFLAQYQRNQARCSDKYGRGFVPPHWIYITMYVEKILLMLNASANFLYYCFSGKESQSCQMAKFAA